jgi:F-box associated protein
MKTSFDNFMSLTSPELPLQSSSKTLTTLPREIILHIFSNLPEYSLRQLSSVCKLFKIHANNDNLWRNIAKSILFPDELQLKPKNISFKDYCKENISYQIVGNDQLVRPKHALKQRDQFIVDKVNQMILPDFKLLNPSETRALFQKPDSVQFINGVWNIISRKKAFTKEAFTFHHVAQQKIGNTNFDIMNCTNHLISFDSNGRLLINNRLTSILFTEINCQLLIIVLRDRFYIYNKGSVLYL